MAKRKRLKPAETKGANSAPEVSEMITRHDIAHASIGVVPKAALRRPPPPIAQVAGDAAVTSALEQVAGELQSAKAEGRMILNVSLRDIDASYLVRDRLVADDDDMATLKASLRARGQQTPIEVVELDEGRYGLISGWRRLTALMALFDETQDTRFGQIQCLIRRPEGAADAYLAMVEENEIRVGLSYYERARIAALAAEQGVYPTGQRAVKDLFASASRAKRSKIGAFLQVHDLLDMVLKFPTALTERFGLELSKALSNDPYLGQRIYEALEEAELETSADELGLIQQMLRGETVTVPTSVKSEPKAPVEDFLPGIRLDASGTRITLTGDNVTDALLDDLKIWLRNKNNQH